MGLSKIFKLTFSVVLSFFIILSSLPLTGLTDIGLLNNINSSVAKNEKIHFSFACSRHVPVLCRLQEQR